MPRSYSVGEFADELGVHTETVKRWCRDGDVDYARTPGGDRRIPERERRRLSSDARPADSVALYARVDERGGDRSGSDADAADETHPDPEDELGRQLDRLAAHAAEAGWSVEATYADVGSGLDEDRDGLQSLLDDVPEADYGRVLVVHDAALARHGGSYLERYVECFGVTVTALDAAPELDGVTPARTAAGDRQPPVEDGTSPTDDAPRTDASPATDDVPRTDAAPATDDAVTASGAEPSHARSRERALEALLDAVDATLQAYAERDYDASVAVDREGSVLEDELLSIVDRVDDLGDELRAADGRESAPSGDEAGALAADPDLVRRLASLLESADRSTAAVSEAVAGLDTRLDEQRDCADAVDAELAALTAAIDDAREPLSDAEAASDRAREHAADGRAAVDRTTELLAEADDATERAQDALAELQSRVAAVGDVVAAIDDIADETHVLALNAQIEAARVDDLRAAGFGVVAEEVKSLAGDARANAAEIEGIVDDVRAETERTADGIETTRTLVDDGRDAAADAAEVLPAAEDAATDATADVERARAALDGHDEPATTAASSLEGLRERLQADASDLDALASSAAESAAIVADADELVAALSSAPPEPGTRSE